MKYMEFCGKKNADSATYFKNSVSILVAYIYKICGGADVHASLIWDSSTLKVSATMLTSLWAQYKMGN